MKSETLSVVALIAVLLVSSVMMGLLVWKIDMPRTKEEAKFFDVRTSTNAVVKVEVGSADINNVGIKDALEILRNEQTNWLAVIGCFGVIFGLVVPVGSYLLQRQSLKDEREQMKDEFKDQREWVEREVNRRTADKLSMIKKKVDEYEKNVLKIEERLAEELDQVSKLLRSQIVAAILSLEATINVCRNDSWTFERTRRSEIISELIFVLVLLRRVDDRKYVKERFKRLAEILREFKGAIEANEEWRVKEGTQTSDVRFDELKWCENECKADYEIIQNILHVLGIHVLD